MRRTAPRLQCATAEPGLASSARRHRSAASSSLPSLARMSASLFSASKSPGARLDQTRDAGPLRRGRLGGALGDRRWGTWAFNAETTSNHNNCASRHRRKRHEYHPSLSDVRRSARPRAHTTASDALWSGLTVVTCLGTTLAARVAARLVNAPGLVPPGSSSVSPWPDFSDAFCILYFPNQHRYDQSDGIKNCVEETSWELNPAHIQGVWGTDRPLFGGRVLGHAVSPVPVWCLRSPR